MADLSREKSVHLTKLHELKQELPWYVLEYVENELDNRKSPSTLLGYARDYHRFFTWLLEQNITEITKITDIPYDVLANLRKSDVKSYFTYLEHVKGYTDKTLNRNISSLKSLFKYLSTQTENSDGECYFYRNVMAKIPMIIDKNDRSNRADEIAAQIFQQNDDRAFLGFVATQYKEMIKNTRAATYFKRDFERDLAILSLFLGSGIRVSELVHLKTSDIDVHDRKMRVLRKGNKKSTIMLTQTALNDVLEYIDIRQQRYHVPDKEQTLFVTYYGGKCSPLSVRTVQSIVMKYTKAFLKKMSPHKLRHTFATKHWIANQDPILLMKQLGHNDINTTTLYTNMHMDKAQEAIDKMDEYRDKNQSLSE